jgi:hypothetical protein
VHQKMILTYCDQRGISLWVTQRSMSRCCFSASHIFFLVCNSEPHMRTLFTASHFCVAFKIQGLYFKIHGGACNACNMRATFVFAWSSHDQYCTDMQHVLSTNVFLFPLVFRHCLVLWNHTAHRIWLRSNRQFWISNTFQLSHHRF